MKELSEMIKGLDSMMTSRHSRSLTDVSKPATSTKDEKQSRRLSSSTPTIIQNTNTPQAVGDATKAQTSLAGQPSPTDIQGSTLSIPAPSIDDLMPQPEGEL